MIEGPSDEVQTYSQKSKSEPKLNESPSKNSSRFRNAFQLLKMQDELNVINEKALQANKWTTYVVMLL